MKRARPRRPPRQKPVRRRSQQRPAGFEFVGDPVTFVCPFCPGGDTVVTAGDIRHLDSTETTGAVLHPVPICDAFKAHEPADFMRVAREHYEQHGEACDHCGKRMIPSRPRAETLAEARKLWGAIGDEHLTLCDECFALEVQRRAKGEA